MPPALILKQSREKVDEEFLEEHVLNGRIVVTTTPPPPKRTHCLREAPPKKKRENVGILKKQGWGGSTRIPLPCFTVFNMGEPPKKVLKCKKKT